MATEALQDEIDERFVRRQWVVQRVGWGLMALIIALALLGLFGTSPLATATEVKDEGGVRAEVAHPRFTRYQLVDRLHVRVEAPAVSGDELRLAFSRDWIDNNNVRGSAPQAEGALGADGAVYAYKVDDWSQPLVVVFEFEPRKSFRNPGVLTVAAGDAPPLEMPIGSWVHP